MSDQATKVDIDELGIIYQVPEETSLSGAEEYQYINAADPRFNLDLVKDDDGEPNGVADNLALIAVPVIQGG